MQTTKKGIGIALPNKQNGNAKWVYLPNIKQILQLFSVVPRPLPTQENVLLWTTAPVAPPRWITKVGLPPLGEELTHPTPRGRRRRVRPNEPARGRRRTKQKRRRRAFSAVRRVATARRIAPTFSSTSRGTATASRPCSASSAAPASPRPARWAATASSRTAYGTTSRTPTTRPTRPRPETKTRERKRGRGTWAAGCAADASTRPRTSTHTSALTAWPSLTLTKRTRWCD